MNELLSPDSPLFWLTARALGVVAYVALTLEVLLGLSATTGLLDGMLGRARVIELHRWLSAIGLGAVVLHAAVLLGDRTVGFGAVDVLVPFASSYRPVAVGLGILAAYAMVVVHLSFLLRPFVGSRFWRKLHAVTFFVFVATTLHGVLAGTDSPRIGMKVLYGGATLLVTWLVFLRLFLRLTSSPPLLGRADGRSRPAPPRPARGPLRTGSG
jgi:sulfoxide reductase heme-binding subunit YedZ